jgi:hypothetical protein
MFQPDAFQNNAFQIVSGIIGWVRRRIAKALASNVYRHTAGSYAATIHRADTNPTNAYTHKAST